MSPDMSLAESVSEIIRMGEPRGFPPAKLPVSIVRSSAGVSGETVSGRTRGVRQTAANRASSRKDAGNLRTRVAAVRVRLPNFANLADSDVRHGSGVATVSRLLLVFAACAGAMSLEISLASNLECGSRNVPPVGYSSAQPAWLVVRAALPSARS